MSWKHSDTRFRSKVCRSRMSLHSAYSLLALIPGINIELHWSTALALKGTLCMTVSMLTLSFDNTGNMVGCSVLVLTAHGSYDRVLIPSLLNLSIVIP